MKSAIRVLLASAAAFALFGCEQPLLGELKPGVSTGYEVRDKMGAPTTEWKNEDGTTTWEYAMQPEGRTNYMVVIGPDNIMREIRQTLTETNFGRVEKGMTHDQIRRLVGKPRKTTTFPLKKEEVWDYRYTGSGTNPNMEFHIHFDMAGLVTHTSRSQELQPY